MMSTGLRLDRHDLLHFLCSKLLEYTGDSALIHIHRFTSQALVTLHCPCQGLQVKRFDWGEERGPECGVIGKRHTTARVMVGIEFLSTVRDLDSACSKQ